MGCIYIGEVVVRVREVMVGAITLQEKVWSEVYGNGDQESIV